MENIIAYERMAMLDLSDNERSVLRERLCSVCDDFSKINEHDTSGVEPLVSVLNIQNSMRDDVSEKKISRDELLKNAPEQQDGYFCVPAAID